MRIKTLAFVALLASAGAASAQTPPDASGPTGGPPGGGHGHGAMRACMADRQTYCGNAERGPASMQCMKDNFAKLSPDCQGAMKAMQARRESHGADAPPSPPTPPSPPAPNS